VQELKILYEDEAILVVCKQAGLAVETKKIAEEDLESLLKKHLAKDGDRNGKKQPPYLAPINRLDQPVRGLVLFARTKEAAGKLSKDLTDGKITKIYRASVFGSFDEPEGTLKDTLVKDGKTNTSRVVKPGDSGYREGKEAILHYKEISPGEEEIRLLTGRHHQIRVQLANAGHPILGDNKYGNARSREESEKRRITQIALTAQKLIFDHPVSGKRMEFEYEE